MNKCPYCGFEIKEGDVFCMNCGAALDEDFTITVEPPKKKKHTALWIILAAVVVILGGLAIYLLNRPELILARATKKTVDELKSDEALSFISETIEHGSIEVNMELGSILSGFSIPLLDEIDARACIKIYNDAEDSEHMIKITGALGGSNALGADIWISPEHLILKSPTFIGREAYGIDLVDRASREEAESLLEQYAGIDARAYDEYISTIQAYADDKEDISQKLLPKFYTEAFKVGDVKTESCKYDFGKGDEKAKIISISFDRNQALELINGLYDYALKEEDLKDFADEIDKRWLDDIAGQLGKDFLTEIKFYIDADGRLARIETKTDGLALDTSAIGTSALDTSASETPSLGISALGGILGVNADDLKINNDTTITSAIQLYDRDLFAALNIGDASVGLNYAVGRNNDKDYSARVDYAAAIADDDNLSISGECDFSWEKDTGRWELYADGGFKAIGELYYDSGARRADAVISKIRNADFTFEPNANIIVIADDAMPDAPEYKTVASQNDVDEFIALVTENVQSLISEFMADYMGDIVGGLVGGAAALPDELPELPEESLEIEGAQSETESAAIEESTKAEEETTAKETEEESPVPIATISNAASASTNQKGEKEAEAETKAGTKTETETKAKTEAGTKAETEAETVKKPDKPVSGTYYYDDGKKFSFNFSTGEYTEHVTVKARLYPDGTYQLVYSNGLISYNDEGTYDRDAKNNMTFSSSTGIDATGKYYDDYIEVTIPGYITEKLQKID